MRQPTRALAVLPLFPVKSNHPEVRGEPNLALKTGGHARKVIPGQAVFAFVETPPFGRSAADAGLGCEPQLPLRVEGHSRHVANRPGPPAIIADLDLLPVFSVESPQPGTRSDVQDAIRRDGHLSHRHVRRPTERNRFAAFRDGEASVGASHVVGSAEVEKLPDFPPGQRRLRGQPFAIGENELRLVRGLECGVHVPPAFLKLVPLPRGKDPDCGAGRAINQRHGPSRGAILFGEAMRYLLPELLRCWLDIGGQTQVNR